MISLYIDYINMHIICEMVKGVYFVFQCSRGVKADRCSVFQTVCDILFATAYMIYIIDKMLYMLIYLLNFIHCFHFQVNIYS